MKTELDALHIKESSIHTLCEEYRKNNQIDPKMYEAYSVKRGLRNADGTGVLAGLTNICNVHGYVINEGEREPVEGWLSYRGINVEDIVAGCGTGLALKRRCTCCSSANCLPGKNWSGLWC